MDTLIPMPARTGTRTAAWLLVLSPLGFVAVVVAGILTYVDSGIDDTALMTPAQMAGIRIAFLVFWPIYAVAVAIGATGLIRLGSALRVTPGRRFAVGAQIAAALSVVSILGTVAMNFTMAGFTQSRLGEHPLYDTSIFLSLLAIWLGAAGAGLAGLALRAAGVRRRTGLVVAVLAALLIVVDTTLTQGAIPPFAVSFLWLALGIAVLRHRVAS